MHSRVGEVMHKIQQRVYSECTSLLQVMKGAQLFFGELTAQGGPYPAEHRTTAPLSPAGIANPGLSLVQVSAEELISSKDWRIQDSKRNYVFYISPWSAVCWRWPPPGPPQMLPWVVQTHNKHRNSPFLWLVHGPGTHEVEISSILLK